MSKRPAEKYLSEFFYFLKGTNAIININGKDIRAGVLVCIMKLSIVSTWNRVCGRLLKLSIHYNHKHEHEFSMNWQKIGNVNKHIVNYLSQVNYIFCFHLFLITRAQINWWQLLDLSMLTRCGKLWLSNNSSFLQKYFPVFLSSELVWMEITIEIKHCFQTYRKFVSCGY